MKMYLLLPARSSTGPPGPWDWMAVDRGLPAAAGRKDKIRASGRQEEADQQRSATAAEPSTTNHGDPRGRAAHANSRDSVAKGSRAASQNARAACFFARTRRFLSDPLKGFGGCRAQAPPPARGVGARPRPGLQEAVI